jgi:hypothetical protein
MDFEKITTELKKSVGKIKDKTDVEFSKKMNAVRLIPNWYI